MKIITLIENLVYKKEFKAEHGLSILIDTGTEKILFDTGQTSAFLSNAEKMGIDIEEIDSVVISHGHYDHTGGLYALLQKNKKAVIYLKQDVFEEKYHMQNRFIGTIHHASELENRIKYVDKTMEIANGVFIIPDIPVLDQTDTSFENFFIKKDGIFKIDEFNDELFIAIIANNKLSVLSSCSHRGITNITRSALKQFILPIHLILGGFHLKESSPEHYKMVTDYFIESEVESLGICHCTGINRFADLKNEFNQKVFYNMTNNIIKI